jgi:hypothetical protein
MDMFFVSFVSETLILEGKQCINRIDRHDGLVQQGVALALNTIADRSMVTTFLIPRLLIGYNLDARAQMVDANDITLPFPILQSYLTQSVMDRAIIHSRKLENDSASPGQNRIAINKQATELPDMRAISVKLLGVDEMVTNRNNTYGGALRHIEEVVHPTHDWTIYWNTEHVCLAESLS